MSKEEPRYSVIAFYPNGPDYEKDRQIEKAAKRESDGAGTDLSSGERDISFSFFRKNTAEAAANRIKAMKGVRVEMYDTKADQPIAI
jgi:hypothetical protein